MQSGPYVSLSAQLTLEKRLDSLALNVANMNTIGYRAAGVSFHTYVSRSGDEPVAYASSGRDYITRTEGPLIATGNPLDIAIQGEGWLAIQTPGGTVYTRDGRMRMRQTGELESLAGPSHPRCGRHADHSRSDGRTTRDLRRRHDYPKRTAGRRESACSRSTRAPSSVAMKILASSPTSRDAGARLRCQWHRPGPCRRLERQSHPRNGEAHHHLPRLRKHYRWRREERKHLEGRTADSRRHRVSLHAEVG